MRPGVVGILCAALLASARADDAAQTGIAPTHQMETPFALQMLPNRKGYAFERPEILLRQRLFGRAHGVSLLAAACLDLPAHAQAVQDAYAVWHARQRKAIESLVQDLAFYYFGPRADEARWPDLSGAMNLPNSIEPALGEITLHAACASLPDAISRPRYELERMLTEGLEPETATPPPRAVTPAPTFRQTAE